MTAEVQLEEHYASYEHWLVINPADQIVEVGQLLAQQVRTVEYLALRQRAALAEFEPDLSGIQLNG